MYIKAMIFSPFFLLDSLEFLSHHEQDFIL